MSEQRDVLSALAHTLDALDVHIRTVDGVAKRSERNRLSMLHLHALAAVVIGPLFASVGSAGMTGATWTVTRTIPGAPFSLGMLLLLGGVILGVATWNRDIFWEKIGLWLLLGWYSIVASSFGAAVGLWWAAGSPPTARPSLYAPWVYTHLAGIMGVHLATLYRTTRRRRGRA